MEGKCLECGLALSEMHGNSKFCCDDHKKRKKKRRQNYRYSLMQPILPVLLKNLEVLDKLYKSPDAKKEFTGEELKKRGLQLNLYITCIEPNGTTKLIFGAYVLIESPDKKTYKIECYDRKHD